MKNKGIISVVVPVYNVEKFLDKCLSSITEQTYPYLEVILVDDGSKDNSPSICEAWAKKDNRIKVFHKENGGLASARNFGMLKTTGTYFSFVDSDDYIDRNMYLEMLETFDLDEKIDIVCCSGQRFFDNNFYDECFVYYETGTILESEIVVKRILKDEIGSQVVKGLYKRHCWDGVFFPVNRLYEDIPVTFMAFAAASKIAFVHKPFYFYRENLESISNTPKPIKPFHIFLGFEQHYIYAKNNFQDIENYCLQKAAHYAISTVFHYYSEKKKELLEPSKYAESFLKEHKSELKISLKVMPKSRRFAWRLFYLSKPLFAFFCKTFHILGLQKKMGFNEK